MKAANTRLSSALGETNASRKAVKAGVTARPLYGPGYSRKIISLRITPTKMKTVYHRPYDGLFRRFIYDLSANIATVAYFRRTLDDPSVLTVTTTNGNALTFQGGQERRLDPHTFEEVPSGVVRVLGDESFIYAMESTEAIPLLDKNHTDATLLELDPGKWMFLKHHGSDNGLIPLIRVNLDFQTGLSIVYLTKNGKVIKASHSAIEIDDGFSIGLSIRRSMDYGSEGYHFWKITLSRGHGRYHTTFVDDDPKPDTRINCIRYDIDTGTLDWWVSAINKNNETFNEKYHARTRDPFIPTLCALSSNFSNNVLSSIFNLL